MPELPTQSEFVRAVREREIQQEKIVTWICVGFGFAYLVLGTFFIRILIWASPYPWRNSIAGFPLISWCVPFIVGFPFYKLYAPRCHSCQTKFTDPGLAVALRHCPHCHEELFRAATLANVSLPRTYPLFTTGVLVVGLFTCGILADGFYMFMSSADIAQTAVDSIQFLMLYSGFCLLCFPVLKYVKVKKTYPKSLPCKICGESFSFKHLRYTGNCSVCSSPLDPEWPPAEPEPLAELFTREHVQKKDKLQSIQSVIIIGMMFICIFIPLFWVRIFSRDETIQLFTVIFGLIFWIVCILVLGRKQEKWGMTISCLYEQDKSVLLSWKFLSYYGRCPNCRRKLVRDDDAGKGAVK